MKARLFLQMILSMGLLLRPFFASAYEVAFIEMRDATGKVLQLEKNGRYAHIALFYQGKWLHSHPFRGVELVTRAELEKMGVIQTIISTPGPREPDALTVTKFLGKPYDHDYSWSDDKIYCSELIAKIMHLTPERMEFNGPVWPEKLRSNHDVGLSPDDIFRYFTERHFPARPAVNRCSRLFE